ncbi:PIN domain-containing protein [Nocardia sp. SYP-A9097]|uniref:type II toxin-antitoxin system VapC family toxin n=1 Tax=Nocardia sp. SYP-A9097 TaxID=2663237 RepID=UPI00129B5900|nr:PIN domain-containing protein [Nocardia sp. SYP-A9097]MRH89104.1 PIN domain-containing protein [Nocardia sp. SYP-A9097]
MTIAAADHILLDTNVLLAATDTARAEFQAARAALDIWPGKGITLYTSGQILREYLCVATRPVNRNGLGLARLDALANIGVLSERLRLLDESQKVHGRLLTLINDTECAGKQVHDANIVATMLTHGVDAIATLNIGDFTRFDKHVRIIKL